MLQIPAQITKMSMSEFRGIVLVIVGVIVLGFYYSWWFMEGRLASPLLMIGFIFALLYTGVQVLGSWLLYLATHHQPNTNCPSTADELTIDVFVTACQEDYAMVEQTLKAACNMCGHHQTWLLDDGRDPALAQLAGRLGAGYLTRTDHKDAKAGNVNAALTHTQGDIIVIFDIDHIPRPDFLEQTLACFTDSEVGFVQVMPTFSNGNDSWVARAASETSLDFYNPTSKGMNGLNSVTKMGTNSLIRRTALDSIGGYQPGLAEDLETSIALHAAGWRSRYIAEPLAPGLAPSDLSAWFTQQFKWARGVFEVLLTVYPRFFTSLTWGQKLSYAVRTTKYLIGPVICIHLFVTIVALLMGNSAVQANLQQYILHFMPLPMFDMLIRQLALRRWRHPSVLARPMWRAVTLVYVTWPIYTLAWVMALLRLRLRFKPTPKESSGTVSLVWLLPQAITLVLIAVGIIYSLFTTDQYGSVLILSVFAAFLGAPQLGLMGELVRLRFMASEIETLGHHIRGKVASSKRIY